MGTVVEGWETVVAVVDSCCNMVGNLARVGCTHIHTGWVVGTHYRVEVGTQSYFLGHLGRVTASPCFHDVESCSVVAVAVGVHWDSFFHLLVHIY